MRQTMLHEYLRKLLLSPDEFMRLLEDPLERTCKRQLVAIGIGQVEWRSPREASCGGLCGRSPCSFRYAQNLSTSEA